MKNKFFILSSLVLFSMLNISCMHRKHSKKLMSNIKPVNKSTAEGWVKFHRLSKTEVRVQAEIKGLKPMKKYGFHIHEHGDCGDNAKKAGGHYNPGKTEHGGATADSKARHAGDLGNLEAGKKGVAVYDKVIQTKCCQFKVKGRSVVIHAGEDDLKSQPSGNSGDRIACGVIEKKRGCDKYSKEKCDRCSKKKCKKCSKEKCSKKKCKECSKNKCDKCSKKKKSKCSSKGCKLDRADKHDHDHDHEHPKKGSAK